METLLLTVAARICRGWPPALLDDPRTYARLVNAATEPRSM